jgi:uncharacterized protein YegL
MDTNGSNSPNGAKPEPDALHVAFVLDKSGSMSHLAAAVVSGFDEFLGELRADGGETLFTLTLFDTEFRHVHVAKPLSDVPSLSRTGYRPGGMTALFDAIAHAIVDTDKRLAAEGRADEKVMVVVMTDGLENSSTDFDADSIAELIRNYDERPNWTFVYLGAAHHSLEDARDTADRLAFKRANAMRWEADDLAARKSMQSLAVAAKQRRSSTAMKTEQLFADAGQNESDYRNEPEADRRKDSPFQRRDLRDVVDRRGRR